jgi:hypothetical protein
MNFLKKFLLCLSITSCSAFQVLNSKKDLKSLSNALNYVIQDQYFGKVWNLDFYVIGGKNCEKFAKYLIEHLIQKNSGGFKSEIHFINGWVYNISLSNPAIFILETNADLDLLNVQLKMDNIDYLKFKHLIVLLTRYLDYYNKESPPNPIKIRINSPLNHEIVVYKNKTRYYIRTFQWFTESCRPQYKIINIFSIKNLVWLSRQFGVEETKQFHGCDVIIPVVSDTSTVFNLFKMIEKKINVSIKSGDIYLPIFTIQNNMEWHLSRGWLFYTIKENEITTITRLGEEYTSYEKLYLPFDFETWIWCGIFFGGGFFIIFIINQTRNRHVQQIVYGSRVRSPAMNVVVAFFGQSQNILPTRSFARFILMMFILFSLIIRTGYQGVQFDLMYKVSK